MSVVVRTRPGTPPAPKPDDIIAEECKAAGISVDIFKNFQSPNPSARMVQDRVIRRLRDQLRIHESRIDLVLECSPKRIKEGLGRCTEVFKDETVHTTPAEVQTLNLQRLADLAPRAAVEIVVKAAIILFGTTHEKLRARDQNSYATAIRFSVILVLHFLGIKMLLIGEYLDREEKSVSAALTSARERVIDRKSPTRSRVKALCNKFGIDMRALLTKYHPFE